MNHPKRAYERAMAYPRRKWEQRPHWRDQPSRSGSTGTVVGLAVLGLVVAAGVYYGADMIRYLKIRRM